MPKDNYVQWDANKGGHEQKKGTRWGGGVEQEDVRKEQQQATGAQILQAI